jgi:hypothetical protein
MKGLAIMTEAKIVQDKAKIDQATKNKMSQFGIVRTTTDVFRVGKYKYSKLSDAIAQAKRDKEKL